MKRCYLAVTFAFSPTLAMAQITPDQQAAAQTAAAVAGPVAPPPGETDYFCYYAGVPYSRGAIINLIGGGRLTCQPLAGLSTAASPVPLGWAAPSN